MKKIICLLLLIAMLLPTAVGCGTESTTTTATTTTGTTPETSGTTPAVTTPNTTGVTTPETPEVTLPEGERLVKDSYTAVLNDEVWTGGSVDTSAYDMSGTGVDIYQKVNSEYKAYTRTYIVVENGVETSYASTKAFAALKKLGVCGAGITVDETAKTVVVKLVPMSTTVLSSWKAVTAKEGAFVRFEFTTNTEMEYMVTVTSKQGGSNSASLYTQDGITVSGENGKYTGIARCTVPYYDGKTLYINISLSSSQTVLASIPLYITPGLYDTGFQLVFEGDWDMVKDETYFDRFTDLFQHTYPKLYKRFALLGSEPKTITLVADKNYTGTAYQSGGRIVINANYLNNASERIPVLSHEATHSVQQFGGKLNYSNTTTYVDPVTGEKKTAGDWFTENHANYGRLRYCEMTYTPQYAQIYNVNTDSKLWDWGYGQYAAGGPMFLAWLDWNYPTTDKNNDGKVTRDEYGALDLMVYTIKNSSTKLSDNPYDPTSPFNKALSTATGGKFSCVEEARLQYAADCKSGAYTFKGFAEYKDNFLTENLPGVPESTYMMNEKIEPTGKTNPILAAAMTTGDNLCADARVRMACLLGIGEYQWANLLDGDLETRLQMSRAGNYYTMTKVSNEIVIDLGAEKTFDTYTLACYASQANQIAKTWEILVSSDGGNYTAVDYQPENTKATVSVTFDEVTARYVKIRLFEPDSKKTGITRLSEFMLFDSKK